MASFTGLAEVLFVIGVAIITIVPRPASSTDCIGGDLASPFRRSVLIITLVNVFRNVCIEGRHFIGDFSATSNSFDLPTTTAALETTIHDVLTSIESLGICFLMLLMPYLLQCRLKDVINIKPGRDLTAWLLVIVILQMIGVVGARYNPTLWAFKRFGDALGCVPVIKTLRLFRRVFSSQRGDNMTIVTLQTLESYSCLVSMLAAFAYLSNNHHSPLGKAVRLGSIFVHHTRVIFHALLLNVMDDANYITPPPTPVNETYFEEVDVPVVSGADELECRKLVRADSRTTSSPHSKAELRMTTSPYSSA